MRFEQIYENTYLYKTTKVAIIRQELTNIFPLLCKVNTELFVEKYLHRTLYYYLSQLKNTSPRITRLQIPIRVPYLKA